MPDQPYGPPAAEPISLVLRLYVAGDAPNSTLARANLRRMLEELDPSQYQLEVIDCLEEPLRAINDGVLVTPTLLRVNPPPQKTVVGALSATARVAEALDLGAETRSGHAAPSALRPPSSNG